MNETLKTIHTLRTIHGNFSEQDISQLNLDLICEAILHTSNASARQSYSILLLKDRVQMKDLFGYQGSRALIFCVDFTRLSIAAKHQNLSFDGDDIISFITGTTDTILAAQTAIIAAKSLGIDSLITNGLHRNNLDKVYRSLHLPETSCFPLITVVLGYPTEEPSYQKGRLGAEFIFHEDVYHELSPEMLDKMVAEYDDHEKHIGLIDNWEKMGFQHYLDWFFTKWCDAPRSEKTATGKVLEFQERLTKCGFWWPSQ